MDGQAPRLFADCLFPTKYAAQEEILPTGQEIFDHAKDNLRKSLTAAVAISGDRMTSENTTRQNLALMAFAKTITHTMSIELICINDPSVPSGDRFLDHFSIAALTRCVIDSTIMTLYQSEPSLSHAEWDLRLHVLLLHDLSNRKRFLTIMGKMDGAEVEDLALYHALKAQFIDVITCRANELGLTQEEQEKCVDGQLVYLKGIRGAVREANLDFNRYEFLHVYLSNFIHAHPVSLGRSKSHAISFQKPSEFQFALCGTCLDAVCEYLDAATARMEIFTGEVGKDPLAENH